MQTMIFALETGVWVALIILVLILGAGLGVFLGYTLRLKKHDKTVADAKKAVSNKKIRAIAEIISEVGSKFDLKKSNARLHSEETTLDESEFQSIYRKIVSLLN